MKGVFFNQPLEWKVELQGESWQQGQLIQGQLSVENHGSKSLDLTRAGVALAYGEVKKVHARTPVAMLPGLSEEFANQALAPGESCVLDFKLQLPENCPINDRKSSFFLLYGREFAEANLQLKVEPRQVFTQVIGLFDTFFRFKVKEIKAGKSGVEYKLIPPTSREMSNVESLVLSCSLQGDTLRLDFLFNLRRLDTSGVTNKISKEVQKSSKELTLRQYSLGAGTINQDFLLKSIEETLSGVKLKSVF